MKELLKILESENRALVSHVDTIAKEMYEIGNLYYKDYEDSCGDEQFLSTAVKWYEKAAKLHNSDAMCKLSEIYFQRGMVIELIARVEIGNKCENLPEKARYWFQKAADLGNISAVHTLASSYFNSKNYHKAFQWYKKAAHLGKADSMYQLFIMYYSGFGTIQNFEEAMHWLKKAAELGIGSAMCDLAKIYYEGNDVEKDFDKAFEWYEKAANLGNVDAMYVIAGMYYEGKGVTKNFDKAVEWYAKADEPFEEGYAKEYTLDEWYKKEDVEGHSDEKVFLDKLSLEDCMRLAKNYSATEDWSRAFKLYDCAAKYDDAEAMYYLSELYYKGKGVTKNLEKAFTYCQKSALTYCQKHFDKGYEDALKLLDSIEEESSVQLADDYFGRRDFKQALEWYEKAAKYGNKYAFQKLASMYENGLGIKQNFEKAAELYLKSDNPDKAFTVYKTAANSGNVNAMLKLAEMYREKSNFEKAIKWYKKAAELDNAEAIYNLGTMYYSGLVVTQNFDKAIWLYEKAASLGYDEAIDAFTYLDADVIIKIAEKYRKQNNLEKAIELYEIAANAGNEDAENIYFALNAEKFIKMAEEHSSSGDWDSAIEFYEKAADFGSAMAMCKLGEIFYEGKGGTTKDHLKSLEWYEKAAKAEDTTAKKFLSSVDVKSVVAIADKFFSQENFVQAFEWYTKAANLNNIAAMYKLAEMYENGQGIDKNIEKAFSWYRKATELARRH